MSRIHVLPESVANRIAAGEVVERPASVVKELVENAIDAGASRIEIHLTKGGKERVRISDDGCGMSAEDLRLAVQRFATSKINSADDLDTIATMGFRGEALPSIGAVAHLQITSRQADSAEGRRIIVRGGQIMGEEPVAAPVGTDVEVTHLFHNTPAREKFMATTATERGHCIEWTQRLALARPDIAFKVVHDGQPVFDTAGQGDVQAVIAAIYGSNDARLFLPVTLQNDDVTISGFVSSPRLTRANRRGQLFFVNNRFVRSGALSHVVTQAYGMLLPAGRQPLCVIHVNISPSAVDPNVHPTKIEVRFGNPGRISSLCQQAVEAALAEAGLRSLTGSGSAAFAHRDALQAGPQPAAGRWDGPPSDLSRRAARLRVNPFADSLDARDDGLEVFASDAAADGQDSASQQALEGTHLQQAPQVLDQLAGRYIVARAGSDLLLIDQHRAAERVLLHQMADRAKPVSRQLLAVPLTLELTPAEAAAVEDHADALLQLGFEFEHFGPSAYLLRSVPTALVGRDYPAVVGDLVRDLAEWQAPSSLDRARDELSALVACHGAIKAGTKLTQAEMQRLVDDLAATEAPAVCPHGDPIIISVSADQLDGKFKRT